MRFAGVDNTQSLSSSSCALSLRGYAAELHTLQKNGALPPLRLIQAPGWHRALVDASDVRLLRTAVATRDALRGLTFGEEAVGRLSQDSLDAERWADAKRRQRTQPGASCEGCLGSGCERCDAWDAALDDDSSDECSAHSVTESVRFAAHGTVRGGC